MYLDTSAVFVKFTLKAQSKLHYSDLMTHPSSMVGIRGKDV